MVHGLPAFRIENLLSHARWVRGLARALVANEGLVDDVVQETWVAAMGKPPEGESPDSKAGGAARSQATSARAWLAGITRNVVRNNRRSEARRVRREHESARGEALPSSQELVEKAEMQRRVVQAVVELPEPYRATLLLRYFEDLSAEDIARRLSVPASTVRNRQRRALALMRKRFDRDSGGDRRAWCLAMIPLAAPSTGVREALVAGTAVSSVSSILTGGMTMLAKGVIVTAGVVLLGGATAIAWNAFDGGEAPDPLNGNPPAAEVTDAAGQAADPAAGNRVDPDPVRVPAARNIHVVRGRITDLGGRPVVGARVFVGAHTNPFVKSATAVSHVKHQETEGGPKYWSKQPLEKLEKRGIVLGRTVPTDENGRYEVQFAESKRVFVRLLADVGIRNDSGEGRWLQTPSREGDFRARRIPTAKIAVTVIDQSTGKRVENYRASITAGERRYRALAVDAATLDRTLEVPSGRATTFTVSIIEPAWAKSSREVVLVPGTEKRVDLFVRSADTFSGRIVSASHETPIEGALVYWGDQSRMRGKRWFGHYDSTRISDGVRTDFLGMFALRGSAGEITVWHPDYSPITVAAGSAQTIKMPARATIRGRILDAQKVAKRDVEVVLDGHHKAKTDATGHYTFEKVEAGVHGVHVGEHHNVAVRLAPGETVTVDHAKVLDEVEVQLVSGGKPYTKRFGAGVYGLDPIFSIREFGTRNGVGKLRRVFPGRYLIVSNGSFAEVDVRGTKAIAELGTASLTIQATPGSTVYLAPQFVKDFQKAVPRGIRRRVPDSGQLTIAPLRVGKYEIGLVGSERPQKLDLEQVDSIVLR